MSTHHCRRRRSATACSRPSTGSSAFLPNLLGFLIILVIGYVVARVVKGILTKVLEKVGLDKALHSGQTGQYVEQFSTRRQPVEADRHHRLLVPLPRRDLTRRLGARRSPR